MGTSRLRDVGLIWFRFDVHTIMQWWHQRIRFCTCSFEWRFILRTVLVCCRNAFTRYILLFYLNLLAIRAPICHCASTAPPPLLWSSPTYCEFFKGSIQIYIDIEVCALIWELRVCNVSAVNTTRVIFLLKLVVVPIVENESQGT
jgi:hypothetical protein